MVAAHLRAITGTGTGTGTNRRRPFQRKGVTALSDPRPPCFIDGSANPAHLGEDGPSACRSRPPDTGGLAHRFPVRASGGGAVRSEEHTSELQSLMRISYAVICLKKKKT